MAFWTKSRLIFNAFRDNARASIRQVARQTGLSKSSVHRLGQAMARRNQHRESWFWETEDGRRWLIRLVVAVLYVFGLKRGVGAETMSAFFACLHLEQHVGCSPTTLRALREQLEALIVATTEAWEREGIAQGQIGPIVGSVDETFLERMILVFMDLMSGYVLLEETADERTYETWYERVRARLEPLKTSVLYLVSDRAKALIKLAQTGLKCPSIADLFHLLHELAKGYALVIWRQLKTACQALSRAQAHLAKCQAEGASEAQIASAQGAVATAEAEVAHGPQVRNTFWGHLEAMSLQVHPWRLEDATPQSAQEVEAKLAAEVAALQE
jgi:IclR helix-turn-helix domain